MFTKHGSLYFRIAIISLIFLCSVTICKENLRYIDEEEVVASIYYRENKYEIEYKYDLDSIAYAKYKKSLLTKGWDFLTLSSYMKEDNKFTDEVKSFAFGYIEGVLTADRIWTHYLNTKNFYLFEKEGQIPDNLEEFMEENRVWINKMSEENKDKDDFWYHVYLTQKQLEGMIEGYNSIASEERKLTYVEFSIINASNEIKEVFNYYKTKKTTDFDRLSLSEMEEYIDRSNHCSVLIKMAFDLSNVWFGHNTWLNFSSMTRIFKEYRFKSNKKNEKSFAVVFSSYPGNLSSNDDFYITDKDLYVSETTSSIFNEKLYDMLTPQSVLTWQRVIVANRLSEDGKTWVDVISRLSSGTLNNQWQILDLKLVDLEAKTVSENALWIVEQIPGKNESSEVTSYLRYGYWPSYNSPFFPSIRDSAGYTEILRKKPELKDKVDYSTCARANLFRRDHSNVNSIEDFRKLIRSNNYQKDPLSKNNPGFAISCRSDLAETNYSCFGATDAKISSLDLIKGKKKKTIYIVAGPTTDNQVPFNSSKSKCIENKKFKFEGLPEEFNFEWIEYNTELFDYE